MRRCYPGEYAIKAAVGHASVPKGGDAKGMRGPWYKSRGGKCIGEVKKKIRSTGPARTRITSAMVYAKVAWQGLLEA